MSIINSDSFNTKKTDSKALNAVSRQLDDDIANCLQTPGGDITRDVYKWMQDNNNNNSTTDFISNRKRSMSFSAISGNSEFLNNLILMPTSRTHSIDQSSTNIANSNDSNETTNMNLNNHLLMTHEEIRAPGGFRRSFIIRKRRRDNRLNDIKQNFITRNFVEFLTLYPHFAGEDLSESENEQTDDADDDDDDQRVHFDISSQEDLEEAIESETETSSLLLLRDDRSSFLKNRYMASANLASNDSKKVSKHKTSTLKTVLLLLKSFVGTGVLFLPKAFHNGG